MPLSSGDVSLAYLDPFTWFSPTVTQIPFQGFAYGDVRVQLTGIASAYTPQWSHTGKAGEFYPCNALDKDGSPVPLISADGLYTLPGGCFVQLYGGSGATATLRAGV